MSDAVELPTGLDLPGPVVARPAVPDDHAALRRLWPLFRHDLSAHDAALPAAGGGYRTERLDAALGGAPGWRAWILLAGPHPVGLALVRALDRPTRVLNSFFVVAPVRRGGLGTRFARAVVAAAPGEWSVAYQDANAGAAAFWPRLAASLDPDWRREHRGVPGRDELPPDTWVSFTVPTRQPAGAAAGSGPTSTRGSTMTSPSGSKT